MQRRTFLKLAPAATLSLHAQNAGTNDLPLPDWAQTGKYSYMGLDGGPLEAEKGLRSGWQYFDQGDSEGVVQAVRDFYRAENVDIPATAGVNNVYVTWTNGWSKVRERQEQWPLAARFMQECRRRGIHTNVYISAANMFWEDYLDRVPESRKWIDVVQPAGLRHYGGSLYRVMANIKLPQWRSEITTSIDAALDAGAEGFWIDNLFWWHGRELFTDFLRDMQRYAARRKPNLVWHTNVNRGIYNWSQIGNVVGTEDGRAAQWNDGADPGVSGNLGLLAFLAGLTEGWRSTELEHYGNDLSGATRQRMIAECWMWGASCTWFPVDRLMQARLHRREASAWKVLEAIGTYNRHQRKYSEYFAKAQPLATVGVVGHPGGSGKDVAAQQHTQNGQGELINLLDLLAGWGVQFEVLFEDRLRQDRIAAFPIVVVADPEHLPDGTAEALAKYLEQGGTVLLPESSLTPLRGAQRVDLPRRAFQAKGSPSLLRDEIRKRERPRLVTANLPAGVVHRPLRQGSRTLVHLINYKDPVTQPLQLEYRGKLNRAEVLIPEASGPTPLQVQYGSNSAIVRVPEFSIHAVVALYA